MVTKMIKNGNIPNKKGFIGLLEEAAPPLIKLKFSDAPPKELIKF
jgi:hypothetical protein